MHQNNRQTQGEAYEVQCLVIDNMHFASHFQIGFTMKPEHQAHPH